MRKSSGWKGSATITGRLKFSSELNPGGAGSRVNHQDDGQETGEAFPLRWRRGEVAADGYGGGARRQSRMIGKKK